MKKTVYGIVFSLLCVCSAGASDISSLFLIKQDWTSSASGRVSSQSFSGWWRSGSIAFGADVDLNRKSSNTGFEVYANGIRGPWHVVLGVSSKGSGGALREEYMGFGMWYLRVHSTVLVLVDARNYVPLNNKSNSFFDMFVKFELPITHSKKVISGVDVIYDRFWNSRADFILLGPYLGYRVTPVCMPYIRISKNYFFANGDVFPSWTARTAVRLTF